MIEVTTGITIDLAGNTAVVTGLQDDYTVEWTAPGHDGVLIEGVAGKYDLGGFNIVNTNAASEFVGQQIVIEDDGPAVSANATALLDDDALPGGNPGGTGDDVDSANTSGTLGHSFGTDGAGSFAFLTTGAPDGFTYELSGSDLLIKQGTTTVVTVTLDTATGAYTVTQNAPIVHAAGSDENNQAFTLNYQVTDGDGDTADGTLAIDVDDDTPTSQASDTGSSTGRCHRAATRAAPATWPARPRWPPAAWRRVNSGADQPLTFSLKTDTTGRWP